MLWYKMLKNNLLKDLTINKTIKMDKCKNCYCEYCGKRLQAIGNQRKNGKKFSKNGSNDWDSRKYHKKCFKAIDDEKTYIMFSYEGEEMKQELFKFYDRLVKKAENHDNKRNEKKK